MRFITSSLLMLASFAMCGTTPAEAAQGLRILKYDIYPTSARLLFEADADGETTLNIPPAFSPQYVRIIPKGNDVKIESFKAVSGIGDFIVPDFLLNDKKAIDAINDKIATLKSDLAGLELSSMILDNANVDNIKQAELENYIKTASALRVTTAKNSDAINKELTSLNEKLKIMTEDYTSRLPKNWNNSTKIIIKAAGKGKVHFEATTFQAGWQPYYDMDLNAATGNISTSMYASAFQATGMVWSGRMEFHTASPSYGNISTVLPPLIVDIFKPAPAQVSAPKANMLRREMEYSDMVMDESVEEYEAPAPTFTETLLSLNITANAVISGDNIAVKVSLKNTDIKSEISIDVIPSVSDKAYITASVVSAPETMPASQIQLYIDGEYSGTAAIGETPKGGKFSIPFGRINGITAKSYPIITQTGSSWTKGTMKSGYNIEVTNGQGKALTVNVIDRIPISVNSKVSVDINTVKPTPAKTTNGVNIWTLKLAPEAKETISVEYTIKYPNDSEINFINGSPVPLN